MKFFFDNNISIHVVAGMKAFGEDVIHLKEKFPENTPDIEWLKYVGENNLALITRDERIRWNPAELSAFQKFKVGAFFLGGKNLDKWKIIQQVVHNWPRIKEIAEKTSPPYAFRIPPHGSKFVPIDIC